MAGNQARIAVEITGDSSDLERALRKSTAGLAAFNRSAARGSKIGAPDTSRWGKFGTTLNSAKTNMGKFASGAAAAGPYLAAAGAAVAAYGYGLVKAAQAASDARREQQKLGAVIRSTGFSAKVSAGQVNTFVDKWSRITGIDDERLTSAATKLLTFKNVGTTTFTDVMKAATNMEAAGFGNLEGNIVQLGKAFNDPVKGITALTRAGVTFTDQQKKQITAMTQSGNLLGAQKIIMKELNSEFSGQAKAAADPFEKMRTSAGNLVESVGAEVLPLFDQLARAGQNFDGSGIAKAIGPGLRATLEGIMPLLGGMAKAVQPVADAFGGALAAAKPLLTVIGGFVGAFGGKILELQLRGLAEALQFLTRGISQIMSGILTAGIAMAESFNMDGVAANLKKVRDELAPFKTFDYKFEMDVSGAKASKATLVQMLKQIPTSVRTKAGIDIGGVRSGSRAAMVAILKIPNKVLTHAGMDAKALKAAAREALNDMQTVDKQRPMPYVDADVSAAMAKIQAVQVGLNALTVTRQATVVVQEIRKSAHQSLLDVSSLTAKKKQKQTAKLYEQEYAAAEKVLTAWNKKIQKMKDGSAEQKKQLNAWNKMANAVDNIKARYNTMVNNIKNAVKGGLNFSELFGITQTVADIDDLNAQIAELQKGTEETTTSWAHLQPVLDALNAAKLRGDLTEIQRLENQYNQLLAAGAREITSTRVDQEAINKLIAERDALMSQDTYGEVLAKQKQQTTDFVNGLNALRGKISKRALADLAMQGPEALGMVTALTQDGALRAQYNAAFAEINKNAASISGRLSGEIFVGEMKKAGKMGGKSAKASIQQVFDEAPKLSIQANVIAREPRPIQVIVNTGIGDPEEIARTVRRVLREHDTRVGA